MELTKMVDEKCKPEDEGKVDVRITYSQAKKNYPQGFPRKKSTTGEDRFVRGNGS